MDEQGQMQVLFLPWVPGHEEIQVGPVHLWPYDTLKREKIKDDRIVQALDSIFASFTDYQGKALQVTVCTHGGYDFPRLEPPQELDVYRAVNAVAFTSICSTVHKRVTIGGSWRLEPFNADGFELHSRTFSFKNSQLVVKAPGLTDIIAPKSARFTLPLVAAGSRWSPDQKLVSGFDKMHSSNVKAEERERIHRAAEFSVMGHMRGQRWTPEARIVMLATALEIILKIANRPDKSKAIAQGLEKVIVARSNQKFVREERPREGQQDLARRGCMSIGIEGILRARNANRQEPLVCTKLGWWGYDFYKIRNAAIHGAQLSPQDFDYGDAKASQFEVAMLILRDVVAREMLRLKLIGDAERDFIRERRKLLGTRPSGKQFAEEVTEEIERSMGLAAVYDKLGWLDK